MWKEMVQKILPAKPSTESSEPSSAHAPLSKSGVLKRVANLKFRDYESWLAIVEDQLKNSIPSDSMVFQRFLDLKQNAKTALLKSASKVEPPILTDIHELIAATCTQLDAAPIAPNSLKEEVERIIQDGYFKSPYFKIIIGGLTLALMLITGVYSYNMHEQVQAIQRIADEAKKKAEESAQDAAKARTESANRQAETALLIVQGNTELAKQRLTALNEMQQATDLFRAEMTEKVKKWNEQIDKAGSDGEDQVNKGTQSTLASHQKRLTEALTSKLNSLESYEHPWVPRVIWSMAKSWVFAPVAFLISLCALVIAASERFGLKHGFIRTVIVIGFIVAIGTIIFVRG